LLADVRKHSLATTLGNEGLTISVPDAAPDAISSTIVLKIKGNLDVEQASGICQDFDGSVLLLASEATLHGDQIKYESSDQRDNIGFWFDPAEWAAWEFTVTKTGNFEVSAEIAAPEKASLQVTLVDQKLIGEVPVTGDYGKFRRVKLGTLQIQATGKSTLAIHGVQEGWHPVNLKSIRLKPLPETK
jgi:hypothetical protein